MSLGTDPYHIHDSQEHVSELMFTEYNQDADIQPEQLSGDENGSRSVLLSTIEGTKANFLLSVTTIIKTVIGSGILAMPFSINKLGWLLGSIVFVLAGIVTQFGSILLLKAKNLSRHSNFTTILYEIWKSKVAKGMSSILIVLNNLGICIAQLIIFKTSIRYILENVLGKDAEELDKFYTNEIFLVLVMAILETPLTLVKKMEKLRFMALSGVAGIVIFMVTFIAFFITSVLDDDINNQPVGNMNAMPQKWFDAAAVVPNILLALSYQMNFFPIFKGMRKANDKKMSLAVLCGVVFCTISYLLVGILGYQYVGKTVQANFLRSLDYEKILKPFYFIINFGFLISIFFAFPIMFFGCRNNFIALVQLFLLQKKQLKQTGWRNGDDQIQHISTYIKDEKAVEKKKKANLHFILYTIGIYLAIVGVSIGVDDIEVVFNVVGAICSTSIGILLPCFFYFKLVQIKRQPKTVKYYVSVTLFLIMTPYALFAIIAQYIKSDD